MRGYLIDGYTVELEKHHVANQQAVLVLPSEKRAVISSSPPIALIARGRCVVDRRHAKAVCRRSAFRNGVEGLASAP